MALTITDPDLIALIRRRTRETGLTVEETLERALAYPSAEPQVMAVAPVPPPRTGEADGARHRRIMALVERIGGEMDPTLSRQEIDDLLYDDHGLPR
jgi:hypothetical protein